MQRPPRPIEKNERPLFAMAVIIYVITIIIKVSRRIYIASAHPPRALYLSHVDAKFPAPALKVENHSYFGVSGCVVVVCVVIQNANVQTGPSFNGFRVVGHPEMITNRHDRHGRSSWKIVMEDHVGSHWLVAENNH
jgi:hypothetical protein